MTCHDVHRALLRSVGAHELAAAGGEVARHLDDCGACRELAASGGALARSLGEGLAPPPPGDGDHKLFARIAADVAAERGLLARWRARPSAQRLLAAAALLAFVCLPTLLLHPRVDLALFPPGRMLLTLAVYLGTGTWLAAAALRSLASRPRRGEPIALGVGLGAGPLILAALPAAHRTHPASLAGTGATLWTHAFPCLLFGLAASLPLLALLWFLERGGQTGRGRALVAAAAAGLGGSLALHLECPITLPPHLLAGHAPVPFVLALLWLAALAALRRARPAR